MRNKTDYIWRRRKFQITVDEAYSFIVRYFRWRYFQFPDLKPIVTKQSTLVNNLQPVSWSSTSNVDDIDTFSNSLFSKSAVDMDVDSMNDSK